MHRCRPRLTSDEHFALWYALMGSDGEKPWRNLYTRQTGNCELAEQLVKRGLMRLYRESPSYRCYHVTEKGADAVGLWLREE